MAFPRDTVSGISFEWNLKSFAIAFYIPPD
jgi:hypothetical protein